MVDGVFHDSVKQSFVRIAAAGNLFGQIVDGKIANFVFEEVATLAPSGEEFVPGNRRLGPVFFGLPRRQGITVGQSQWEAARSVPMPGALADG